MGRIEVVGVAGRPIEEVHELGRGLPVPIQLTLAYATPRAAEAATRPSTPPLGFRASAEYRRTIVGVLTRRTPAMALAEARSRT